GREPGVAAAVHPNPAIAPGLGADPIDQRGGIAAIETVRRGLTGAAYLSARESNDAGISARRGDPRQNRGPPAAGVNGEGKQSGQPRWRARPPDEGANRRAIRKLHRGWRRRDVSAPVVFLDGKGRLRREGAVGIGHLIVSDELERRWQVDGALSFQLLPVGLECCLERAHVGSVDGASDERRSAIVEPPDYLAESFKVGLGERLVCR